MRRAGEDAVNDSRIESRDGKNRASSERRHTGGRDWQVKDIHRGLANGTRPNAGSCDVEGPQKSSSYLIGHV